MISHIFIYIRPKDISHHAYSDLFNLMLHLAALDKMGAGKI